MDLHVKHKTEWQIKQGINTWCTEAYLSSQLKTFVAIVISVVHLVVPLSQDHPPNHHSQVNTLSPKVKLFDLQTKHKMITTLVCVEYTEYNP